MKPLIKGLIEDERCGEAEGGLGFVEVELDSTLIGDLGVKYMVCRHYLLLWIRFCDLTMVSRGR